jgi:hypothetical protein
MEVNCQSSKFESNVLVALDIARKKLETCQSLLIFCIDGMCLYSYDSFFLGLGFQLTSYVGNYLENYDIYVGQMMTNNNMLNNLFFVGREV